MKSSFFIMELLMPTFGGMHNVRKWSVNPEEGFNSRKKAKNFLKDNFEKVNKLSSNKDEHSFTIMELFW